MDTITSSILFIVAMLILIFDMFLTFAYKIRPPLSGIITAFTIGLATILIFIITTNVKL